MTNQPLDDTLAAERPVRALSAPAQLRILALATAGVLASLLLFFLVLRATAPSSARTATPPPAGSILLTPEQFASLTIVRAGGGPAGQDMVATGTISFNEDRLSPILLPYNGQVSAVFVSQGSTVRRGQPLLAVNAPDLVDARNALRAAVAQRQGLVSQLAVARETARRQGEIYRTAGGALKDYRQAQNDLASVQAAVSANEAATAAARDKLALLGKSGGEIVGIARSHGMGPPGAQTVLRAPIGGVVASRSVGPGQYVTAGGDKPVMTIADPSRLWLVAQLAESDAGRVRVGDVVEVTTPAYPGRRFQAIIDNIAAALDPATHRLPVRASIANPDLLLKPQMFASFVIHGLPAGAAILTVPAAAVVRDGDSARVWVLLPGRRVVARPVVTGDTQDGRVSIISGLRAGERVVSGGALFVNEAGSGA